MMISLQGTHYIDISGTAVEKKKESLRAHVSQLGEGEAIENGAIKWIIERNAEMGEKVGVEHAEWFNVMTLNEYPKDEDQAETVES